MEKSRSTISYSVSTFPVLSTIMLPDEFFHLCLLYTWISYPSVVGQEELDTRSVNVRNRDDVGTKTRSETIPLDKIIQKFVALKDRRSSQNKLV